MKNNSQGKVTKMIKRIEGLLFDGGYVYKYEYLRQNKMNVYKNMRHSEKIKIALFMKSRDCEIRGQNSLKMGVMSMKKEAISGPIKKGPLDLPICGRTVLAITRSRE